MAGWVTPTTNNGSGLPPNPYGTHDPRYAVFAKQQADQTKQDAVDAQYIQNRGNINQGTSAPSFEAIDKLKAMTSADQLSSLYSGGSGGGSSSSSSSSSGSGDTASELRLRAQLQQEAETRRVGQIKSLIPGGGSGGAPSEPLDDSAARAAIYARTKDQIGQQTRSAIDTLRSMYAGTGNLGAVNKGTNQIVEGGMGEMGEFSRDQMIEDLKSLDEHGKEDRSLALARRGQDMSMIPALYGLVTARGLY